jgi:hypothetical protein
VSRQPLHCRVVSTSAFSTQQRHQDDAFWAMAAVAGLFSGAALTLCEKQKDDQDPVSYHGPETGHYHSTKGGVRDPKTQWASKEPLPVVSSSSSVDKESDILVQATSTAVNIKVQPTELMTSDEKVLEDAARKAKQHSGGLKLFSGNGNMSLALEIAKQLGINLGKATVGRFADGEVNVVIHENVRAKDVYVVQPTGPPVNDNIMELLLMVSTLRRASARRITVVIPYYGYARQDRKMQVCLAVREGFVCVSCRL